MHPKYTGRPTVGRIGTGKLASVDVPLKGKRNRKSAPNSLQFLAHVEGVEEYDGAVRSANGIRWKVA